MQFIATDQERKGKETPETFAIQLNHQLQVERLHVLKFQQASGILYVDVAIVLRSLGISAGSLSSALCSAP